MVECRCRHSMMSIQSVRPLKTLCTSPPGRPVHSDNNSTSLGSIPAMQHYNARRLSTFPPLYMASNSFIQLSELGHHGDNEYAKTSKQCQEMGYSNPGSLDCETDILPLSYCEGQAFFYCRKTSKGIVISK